LGFFLVTNITSKLAWIFFYDILAGLFRHNQPGKVFSKFS